MWMRGGATPNDPEPYLKTVLCRVLSISAVVRAQRGREIIVSLNTLPKLGSTSMTEAELLTRFLDGVGRTQPQLVGYNSVNADIPILIQRSLANGVRAPGFCKRPSKPWEGIDYFAKYSDYHIDLKDLTSGWGQGTPSLHELASVAGIPGKLDVSGQDVGALWRAGDIDQIVAYNECDAVTTYLLWLRCAHFAGHFSPEHYMAEQALVESMLEAREQDHAAMYLKKWRAMRKDPVACIPPSA
jgi:predicted PolB exonuclease-like 3'-5' exonuclease